MFELEVFAGRDALYAAAAHALASAAQDGLIQRGRAILALAGGRTPAPIYARLAKVPIAWKQVTVLLTDERRVPPSHADSNERMVKATLFHDHATAANFATIQDAQVSRLHPFDGVLLGMGEDGHFASLFPGSRVLARGLDLLGDAFVLDVPAAAPEPPQLRFTLTLRALSGAGVVVLALTGGAKRATLERAFDDQLPVAAMIHALQPRILWAN